MDKLENIIRGATVLVRASMIAMMFFFLTQPDPWGYFLSGFGLVSASLLLVMKEKEYQAKFPAILGLLINIALSLHLFGYAFELYSKIPHYDKWLHFINAGIGALLGYSLFLAYQIRHKITINHKLAALSAVLIGMMLGDLWELIEFSIDQLRVLDFSLATRHSELQWGLDDTMKDMRLNLLGAFTAGIMGWIVYSKKSAESIAAELVYLTKIFK